MINRPDGPLTSVRPLAPRSVLLISTCCPPPRFRPSYSRIQRPQLGGEAGRPIRQSLGGRDDAIEPYPEFLNRGFEAIGD